MKAGQLIQRVARIFGADEEVARRVFRYLRQDGLITTGSRGVNAPDMTALDAARLLIAFMCDTNPGKAATRLVLHYGQLRHPGFDRPSPPLSIEAMRGRSPATFEDGLAGLLEIYAHAHNAPAFREAGTHHPDGFRPPECLAHLDLDPQPAALVKINRRHESGWQYHFNRAPLPVTAGRATDERSAPVVMRSAALAGGAIGYIAEGFRK